MARKPKAKGGARTWAADSVVRKAVADLVPYAANARTHSAEQVAQIAASIEEWGWTVPVLVDEAGMIIAGHGRVLAAERLGIVDVPCMVATGWTEAQKRAYVIADNKLALNAGWDDAQLRLELQDLAGLEFDLALMGWAEDELQGLLLQDEGEPGLTDDDAVPPQSEVPAVSRRGDVWLLGQHRVMCGSSTSAADMDTLMAGEHAHACWTDPPYNVDYKTAAGSIKNDNLKDSEFRQFLSDAFGVMFDALRPGGPVYVAHADIEGLNFRRAFLLAGFKLSGCLVWVKPSLVLGRSDYQWRHEPILYGWRPGAAHPWFGGRKKTSVFERDGAPFTVEGDGDAVQIDLGSTQLRITGRELHWEELLGSIIRAEKPRKSAEHPTMKPVALISDMLVNSTQKGWTVLDPFGGSGSTLIACHKLGRAARVMELDPRYVDVIVRRWEEFCGREATLENTGQTFASVGVERGIVVEGA